MWLQIELLWRWCGVEIQGQWQNLLWPRGQFDCCHLMTSANTYSFSLVISGAFPCPHPSPDYLYFCLLKKHTVFPFLQRHHGLQWIIHKAETTRLFCSVRLLALGPQVCLGKPQLPHKKREDEIFMRFHIFLRAALGEGRLGCNTEPFACTSAPEPLPLFCYFLGLRQRISLEKQMVVPNIWRPPS